MTNWITLSIGTVSWKERVGYNSLSFHSLSFYLKKLILSFLLFSARSIFTFQCISPLWFFLSFFLSLSLSLSLYSLSFHLKKITFFIFNFIILLSFSLLLLFYFQSLSLFLSEASISKIAFCWSMNFKNFKVKMIFQHFQEPAITFLAFAFCTK